MCLPLLAPPCLQREVHSCQELVVALNDASVSRVQLMPVPGGYNCSAEDIAPQSIIVAQGREVLLEGAGPEPVYVDVRSCVGRRRGLTRVFRCHVHIEVRWCLDRGACRCGVCSADLPRGGSCQPAWRGFPARCFSTCSTSGRQSTRRCCAPSCLLPPLHTRACYAAHAGLAPFPSCPGRGLTLLGRCRLRMPLPAVPPCWPRPRWLPAISLSASPPACS